MFFACSMHQRWLRGLVITALATLLVSSCGGGGGSNEEQAQSDTSTTGDEDRHLDLNIGTAEEAADNASQDLTPIVAVVPHAPIPFAGSDGRTHLVYELETTNFSGGEITIEQLEVLDPDTVMWLTPSILKRWLAASNRLAFAKPLTPSPRRRWRSSSWT